MNAPFDNKTQWNILAIKHKGTIYLCEYKTDEQHDDLESLPHWVKKTFYWGRKVETFLTANEPGGPPRPEEPVNENSEYVSVFRSQLGQIQLMYGAEVDCVDHTLDPEVVLVQNLKRYPFSRNSRHLQISSKSKHNAS